jgi:hypothetical protein
MMGFAALYPSYETRLSRTVPIFPTVRDLPEFMAQAQFRIAHH